MTKAELWWKLFDWAGLVVLVIGFSAGYFLHFAETTDLAPAQATMRTTYPGEERIATAACRRQNQKVMYWWLEDPRKGGALMHVRCTGQVRIDEEVKF